MEKNHLNNKTNRSKAIRRLVIWYRRNSAVTSLVDTATSSASAASNVAGTVGSNTNGSNVLLGDCKLEIVKMIKMEFKIPKGFGLL